MVTLKSITDSSQQRSWFNVLLILALQPHPGALHTLSKTALKFGLDNHSLIFLQPDLSPASEALSVCAWVKRNSNHLSNYQYWLSYVDQFDKNELVISDTGRFFLFKGFTSQHDPHLGVGEWHHMCMTWWFPSRTKIVYFDGVEVASSTTPKGRKFRTPGTMMLGQLHKKYGGGGIKDYHFFGGELLDFNIFSKKLTSGVIKEMHAEGKCSDYSWRLGVERVVSWENILNTSRHGNVTETRILCDDDHTPPANTEAPAVLISTEQGEADDYTDLLEGVEHYVFTSISEKDTTSQAPRSTENLNMADIFAAIKAEDTVASLEKKSDEWEFLYSSHFFQKAITESFLAGMIRRLDMIVEYFGQTIEETLINDDFIACMGRRLNLLIEFYGHTLDDHLIEHLKLHHSSSTEIESNDCGGFLWLQVSAIEF